MGKIRRVRQKLHQSSSSTKNDSSSISDQELNTPAKQTFGLSPLLNPSIPDNLFGGINIDFENLQKKLEDDRISVRSIAKSCKFDSSGKLLTKKEKKKLKHDLFMRKLNTSQQLMKEVMEKRRNRKGLNKSGQQIDHTTNELPSATGKSVLTAVESAEVSSGDDTKSKKKDKKKKPKGIKKAKVRQREMLEEIAAFRKIINDEKFLQDPSTVTSECVQRRIFDEIKKK